MLDILNLFVSTAYADTAAAAPQGSGLSLVLMFVVFFLFVYFAVWRPQSKRAKEQQQLMSSLTEGDEIVTIGGLYGRITKISDNFITLTIAKNVDILIQKSSVANALPKGTLQA